MKTTSSFGELCLYNKQPDAENIFYEDEIFCCRTLSLYNKQPDAENIIYEEEIFCWGTLSL